MPQPITHLGGTQIAIIPDMHVAPGQQWIAVENTPIGRGLVALFGHEHTFTASQWIICPHDLDTDRMLMDLVDVCAKIRLAAPRLVQLEFVLDAQ
jgi:hypothetical protein